MYEFKPLYCAYVLKNVLVYSFDPHFDIDCVVPNWLRFKRRIIYNNV